MATVDILLPVKNGIRYLAASLDSIRNQSFFDWRLRVLDHGSDDGSLDLAESYAEKDARIVVHRLPDAVGLSGLLNQGLEISDCKYVLRHDADDVAFPDRIERSISAFRENTSFIAIGGQADLIDENGTHIGSVHRPTDQARISA